MLLLNLSSYRGAKDRPRLKPQKQLAIFSEASSSSHTRQYCWSDHHCSKESEKNDAKYRFELTNRNPQYKSLVGLGNRLHGIHEKGTCKAKRWPGTVPLLPFHSPIPDPPKWPSHDSSHCTEHESNSKCFSNVYIILRMKHIMEMSSYRPDHCNS